MSYVSRDPFARQETHKARVKGGECAWCGQRDPGHPLAFQEDRPSHRIWRYRTESDGGRVAEDTRTFCSLSCRRAFYGE